MWPTLPRIARRYGVSVSSLAAANALYPRSKISRGQEIMVPEKVASVRRASSAPAKAAKSKKASSPARVARASVPARAASEHESYRVRSGDTLYRIALKHGVTVAEILAINSLGGGAIRPGDKLKIPAKK